MVKYLKKKPKRVKSRNLTNIFARKWSFSSELGLCCSHLSWKKTARLCSRRWIEQGAFVFRQKVCSFISVGMTGAGAAVNLTGQDITEVVVHYDPALGVCSITFPGVSGSTSNCQTELYNQTFTISSGYGFAGFITFINSFGARPYLVMPLQYREFILKSLSWLTIKVC